MSFLELFSLGAVGACFAYVAYAVAYAIHTDPPVIWQDVALLGASGTIAAALAVALA